MALLDPSSGRLASWLPRSNEIDSKRPTELDRQALRENLEACATTRISNELIHKAIKTVTVSDSMNLYTPTET
eukprot:2779227-Amphidinium_carterae.1